MSRIRSTALAITVAAIAFAAPSSASAATMVFGSASDGLGRVVFSTTERMVPADLDSSTDVYDRSAGVTRLVSIGPAGGNGAFNTTFHGISDGGGRIVFSTLERLTANDLDNNRDVYYLENGVLDRASVGDDVAGNGAFDATFAGFERGSERIAFHSAEQLAAEDDDTAQDVWYHNNGTAQASIPPTVGGQNGDLNTPATFAGFGGSGAQVYFHTTEQLSSADDDGSQDIYSFDTSGPEKFVSDSTNDAAVPATFKAGGGGDDVIFESAEEVVDGLDNDGTDVDVWTRHTGTDTTTLDSDDFTTASVSFQGISELGGLIYIETTEAEAGDTDTVVDVYELDGGVATLVSEEDGNGNDDQDALFAGVDDDGDHVAFTTTENMFNEGDGDTAGDVYEFSGGDVELGSVDTTGSSATFRGYSTDGSRLLFSTVAKAAANDLDSQADVYANVNQSNNATKLTPGNANVGIVFGRASTNGLNVVYTTQESLVAQDGDAETDVYKTLNGTTTTLESFEIVPPETTITSGPTGLTAFSPPPFTYVTNEAGASFSCRYDGAAFGPCGSLAPLSQGAHTFQVRATDRAGNVDATPASRSFTVDTIGPRVAISRKARRANRKRRFTVTLVCPAGENGGCKGKLTLRSQKKVRVGKRKRVVTFASSSFTLKSGQRKAVTMKLSKKNLALLRKLKKVRLVATAVAADGVGNKHTNKAGLTLRAPKTSR